MENAETHDVMERKLATVLKSEPETWTADCLAPERILALAEHSLPEQEASPLMAHVALCARCRREYAETVELLVLAEEVHALEAEREKSAVVTSVPVSDTPGAETVTAIPPPETPRRSIWKQWFSPALGFSLGAAAASLILYFAWAVPANGQRDRLAATVKAREAELARMEQERQQQAQQFAAVQQQGKGEAGRLTKQVDRLNAEVKTQRIQIARLNEAESALQQMPLPTAGWRLAPENAQMRGGSGELPVSEIALVSPVDTAVLDTMPTLECRPIPGATDYQISLERADSNEEIPAPKRLAATRWKAAIPLSSGKVYQWAVTAQSGTKQLRSPLAKFYVLSEAERQEVRTARLKYADSPLTLGALFARLGLRNEAEQALRAALKTNERSVAERWLLELQEPRR